MNPDSNPNLEDRSHSTQLHVHNPGQIDCIPSASNLTLFASFTSSWDATNIHSDLCEPRGLVKHNCQPTGILAVAEHLLDVVDPDTAELDHENVNALLSVDTWREKKWRGSLDVDCLIDCMDNTNTVRSRPI